MDSRRHEAPQSPSVCMYSTKSQSTARHHSETTEEIPCSVDLGIDESLEWEETVALEKSLDIGDSLEAVESDQVCEKESDNSQKDDMAATLLTSQRIDRFARQPSAAFLRAQRPVPQRTILAALDTSARRLYMHGSTWEPDLPHDGSRSGDQNRSTGKDPRHVSQLTHADPVSEFVSLSTILTRYLTCQAESGPQLSTRELEHLRTKGYTPENVQNWAACVIEPSPDTAVSFFDSDAKMPPLFMVQLYLHRITLRIRGLKTIMKHIQHRAAAHPIPLHTLKLLIVRLLRHARIIMPELIPKIASLFTVEVARTCDYEGGPRLSSPHIVSDITLFCNNLLSLLSLPTKLQPVISAKYQAKAHTEVLQYMASVSPAILVTREGFRAVTAIQLAQPKTYEERVWAELKGPLWPPWKENRTAMDEDKDYEFAASRASQVMHRMYEAGYGDRLWEKTAQIYAGWDVDTSPTIQTRTILPAISMKTKDRSYLQALQWAARIRTTRTRREAWACFLSCEQSREQCHKEIFLAMFEKLHYPDVERITPRGFQSEPDEKVDEMSASLLPGDMKEVMADPVSPLHNVYLSEPVPTFHGLLRRMHAAKVRPSDRLFAFLVDACPEVYTGLKIIQREESSGMAQLLAGIDDKNGVDLPCSGYEFAALIRFLCRFGRVERPLTQHTFGPRPQAQHMLRLQQDRHYLLEYAHALLSQYRPRYRPAWTAYVQKIVAVVGNDFVRGTTQSKIVWDVVKQMRELDLDVDDDIFRLVCTATRYAGQEITKKKPLLRDDHSLRFLGPPRLRALFNSLTNIKFGAGTLNVEHNDDQSLPSHIPSPATLHAYVRALSILRDYEGLFSFATWLAMHHEDITARAEAQHAGTKHLFRTLVALRAAVDGAERAGAGASADLAQLIRAQIESIEEWGGWPAEHYVQMYVKRHLKTDLPKVGGR